MTVRILAVCGAGQGSSMLMKMKIGQFLKRNSIDHKLDSCAVAEYKTKVRENDILIASEHIAKRMLAPEGKHIIGVKNILSETDFGPPLIEIIEKHFMST